MKRAVFLLIAGCAAALLLQARPAAGAENAGQTPEKKAREEKAPQMTAEDREVIEHMEMLKNLKFYDNEDMELLLTLDVLTANE